MPQRIARTQAEQQAVLRGNVTESAFQAQVIEYAEARLWLVYHTYRSTRSPAGFPDLVLVRLSRCIFAELKTEKGRPSPAQLKWLDALDLAGETAYLWRPSDWERICELLN